MPVDIYSSYFIQTALFSLLALTLVISVISLFLKPAKRTIRASLVERESGHIVDISQAETSIGRAKACDVVIPVMSVSRFHAVLSKRKSGWMIFDTNSTSGVLLNGEKIEDKAFLNDGDELAFGNAEYIFYSTAVTTRQQVVPKTRRVRPGERSVYRKRQTPSDDSKVEYRQPGKRQTDKTNNDTKNSQF